MAEGFLVGAAIASVTQMLSTGITSGKEQTEAMARDQSICDQLQQTQNRNKNLDTLLSKLAAAKSLQDDSKQMIQDLQSQAQRDITAVKQLKSTFNLRRTITIIVNIVLTLIVGIQLFS